MGDAFDLVIRADRVLVDGSFRPASVGVRDGRIVAIGDDLACPDAVRLPADEVLIPGLVDTHVHVNEPGRTDWEGFASASRAAAAGGVTTIVDMPLNSIPPTIDPAALDAKRARASQSVIDVGFWGGAVPVSLGRLRALHERGVFGFKCFLAPSGVDEFPHLDTAQLNEALDEIAGLGSVLIVHAEDPGVLDAHEGTGGRRYDDFVASRPDDAELTAIGHVIDGVRRSGARAHILHLSSARALPMLAAAKAEGLPITVETCPHYLSFHSEAIADGATEFKCCPPIRDERNRDLLWGGLLDGVIDIVVSDHSPSTRELKLGHGGDFSLAWGGIAGLQVGLAAVWTEASRRGIPLESVVRWMSTRPAELMGVPGKGSIVAGAQADLVAFAPDAGFPVRVDELQHKNRVSAFDGMNLHGRVRRTWVRGRPVDIAADARPEGRLITRAM